MLPRIFQNGKKKKVDVFFNVYFFIKSYDGKMIFSDSDYMVSVFFSVSFSRLRGIFLAVAVLSVSSVKQYASINWVKRNQFLFLSLAYKSTLFVLMVSRFRTPVTSLLSFYL